MWHTGHASRCGARSRCARQAAYKRTRTNSIPRSRNTSNHCSRSFACGARKPRRTSPAALASRRYKKLVARLSAPIAITTQGDAAFGSVAGELFAPMLKSMMRAGEKLPEDPSPDELHRLRKRAKGSRYALETMLAIDEQQLGEMLQSLEDLQDLVGEYHDAVVAVAWVKEFVAARELPASVAFACGALVHAIHRTRTQTQAPRPQTLESYRQSRSRSHFEKSPRESSTERGAIR